MNVVQRRGPSKVSAVQPAGYWEVSGAASGPPLERSRRFFVACKVRLMPALLPEEETMTKTLADFMLECLTADPAAPHHHETGEELCKGAPEGKIGREPWRAGVDLDVSIMMVDSSLTHQKTKKYK